MHTCNECGTEFSDSKYCEHDDRWPESCDWCYCDICGDSLSEQGYEILHMSNPGDYPM